MNTNETEKKQKEVSIKVIRTKIKSYERKKMEGKTFGIKK
jgi:hypothetical protein